MFSLYNDHDCVVNHALPYKQIVKTFKYITNAEYMFMYKYTYDNKYILISLLDQAFAESLVLVLSL